MISHSFGTLKRPLYRSLILSVFTANSLYNSHFFWAFNVIFLYFSHGWNKSNIFIIHFTPSGRWVLLPPIHNQSKLIGIVHVSLFIVVGVVFYLSLLFHNDHKFSMFRGLIFYSFCLICNPHRLDRIHKVMNEGLSTR
jgi:hypothetical protein